MVVNIKTDDPKYTEELYYELITFLGDYIRHGGVESFSVSAREVGLNYKSDENKEG